MKILIRLLYVCILVFIPSLLKAQEFLGLSQYMCHKQFYNPAAMSSYSDINAVMLYRNQWVGLEGSPTIYSLSGSIPFEKTAVGVGLQRYTIGVHETNNFLLSYSFRIQLGYLDYLAFGLSAGFKFHKRNYSKVLTHEKYDDYFSTDVRSTFIPNFQFGMFYFSSKYYFGFSIPSLIFDKIKVENKKIKTDYSFETKKVRFYFEGGYEYDINEMWSIDASSLLKYESNSPLELDITVIPTYLDKISLGLSYRTKNEWMVLFNMRINKELRFGYAYHITEVVGKILNSHELLLSFTMNRKERRRPKIERPRF
ncbi:type IX secretion system membrane protein PorP/SprF [Marinilabiliaceae bacterium JC040]|nr:type IX secretion system membrane protein PorP/SprF [Marinilabiliaceae bacterium JC040]